MTLKNQLEARLKGIGYKEGGYIDLIRLLKILKSLQYVYIYNIDVSHSSLIGYENRASFPKDVKIISITERPNQIWQLGVGNIMSIEVGVSK